MAALASQLAQFNTSRSAQVGVIQTPHGPVPKIFDEFWTAKQRQMHSLHYAVSYRASFKPELPDFFIRGFTQPGDVIGDPFGGRGTTALQANILGRRAFSNDVNPLSERVAYPKVHPVPHEAIEERLEEIGLSTHRDLSKEDDLSMFYHESTYRELLNLRDYLKTHHDDVDRFIEMVAISRLHGHSVGFFSAYSFPQISIPRSNQLKINKTRGIDPDYREIGSRIAKKAKAVLKDGEHELIRQYGEQSRFTTGDSRNLESWEDESVNLVVTSPPFLDTVDYIADSWLEMWFCGIDNAAVNGKVVQTGDLEKWIQFISDTLSELHRVLVPGGLVAMEVGEVRHQGELLNLDETLLAMTGAKRYNGGQYKVRGVYIQNQEFTKLANCFKVTNNVLGTNSNRIVLMEKI